MIMKVKVIIAALLLAGAGMSANAQSTDDNWFLQGQLGASYSLDGTGIGKLISPAGQIAAGKYFNPYVGARLAVSGWRGRAGSGSRPAEGFYYGAATVDGLFNMSSLFCGSIPNVSSMHALSRGSVTTGPLTRGRAASWQGWASRQASA